MVFFADGSASGLPSLSSPYRGVRRAASRGLNHSLRSIRGTISTASSSKRRSAPDVHGVPPPLAIAAGATPRASVWRFSQHCPASASSRHRVSSGSQNTQTLQVACARHRAQHADADAAKPRVASAPQPPSTTSPAYSTPATPRHDAETFPGGCVLPDDSSGTSAPWSFRSFRVFASSRGRSRSLGSPSVSGSTACAGRARVRGALVRSRACVFSHQQNGGHRRGGDRRSSPVSRSLIAATSRARTPPTRAPGTR